MNRIYGLLALTALSGLAATWAVAADKTDPAHDIYIENSTTNFVLSVKGSPSETKSVAAYDITAPTAGPYTLVSFIEGKFYQQENFESPGTFKLSKRGLTPGTRRLTLQLVDKAGRVGRWTGRLEVK